MRQIVFPRMKETTCKKLQEIGAFALAGGCTRKRMKEIVEMIRAARDYRWVAVYKIIKNEFVIMAETGNEPPAYARFPITQGLCGAALESGKPIIVGDVSKDLRYLPAFHTTRSEIIVPMRNDHRHVLGMLDADSDKLNAFGEEDLQFLERAGGLIAHCLPYRCRRARRSRPTNAGFDSGNLQRRCAAVFLRSNPSHQKRERRF